MYVTNLRSMGNVTKNWCLLYEASCHTRPLLKIYAYYLHTCVYQCRVKPPSNKNTMIIKPNDGSLNMIAAVSAVDQPSFNLVLQAVALLVVHLYIHNTKEKHYNLDKKTEVSNVSKMSTPLRRKK